MNPSSINNCSVPLVIAKALLLHNSVSRISSSIISVSRAAMFFVYKLSADRLKSVVALDCFCGPLPTRLTSLVQSEPLVTRKKTPLALLILKSVIKILFIFLAYLSAWQDTVLCFCFGLRSDFSQLIIPSSLQNWRSS